MCTQIFSEFAKYWGPNESRSDGGIKDTIIMPHNKKLNEGKIIEIILQHVTEVLGLSIGPDQVRLIPFVSCLGHCSS